MIKNVQHLFIVIIMDTLFNLYYFCEKIAKKMLHLFRIVSYLEGISYLLLLFIGVPFKYFGSNDVLVKALGMPHGLLFISYIIIALFIRPSLNWNKTSLFIVLIASVVPFGTLYVDKKYLKNQTLVKA